MPENNTNQHKTDKPRKWWRSPKLAKFGEWFVYVVTIAGTSSAISGSFEKKDTGAFLFFLILSAVLIFRRAVKRRKSKDVPVSGPVADSPRAELRKIRTADCQLVGIGDLVYAYPPFYGPGECAYRMISGRVTGFDYDSDGVLYAGVSSVVAPGVSSEWFFAGRELCVDATRLVVPSE